jgi:prepilin signal peptidase PulO-like enzyme (type II secretory pathway)
VNVLPAYEAVSLPLTTLASSALLLGAVLWPDRARSIVYLLRRGASSASMMPRRRGLAPSIPFRATAALLLVALLAPLAVVGPWPLFASLPLGLAVFLLALIDARLYRLPDGLTLPLLLAGLVSTSDPDQSLAGLVLWTLLPLAVETLSRRLGGRSSLGRGDVKLMAATGAWLGPVGAAAAIALAAIAAAGAVLALAAELRRPPRQVPIAFGVFLALGLWWVWLATAA